MKKPEAKNLVTLSLERGKMGKEKLPYELGHVWRYAGRDIQPQPFRSNLETGQSYITLILGIDTVGQRVVNDL